MKILLVEDTVGGPIKKVLAKWGHDVALAKTGLEARALLRVCTFEFCLIDWMLPDICGLDLVDDIRKDARHRDAGILVISSRSGRADIVTALRTGIDGYVTKPFNAVQLRARIDEVLQRRSRDRASSEQIRMVLGGQEQLQYKCKNPLIVFGEQAVTAKGLGRMCNAHVLDYLATATTAINEASALLPTLDLGYYITDSTGDVSRLLQEPETRKRVQIAFVSTDCTGNCTLLAKLMHQRDHGLCPICIVCDHHTDLSVAQQTELERCDTLVLERRQLDASHWRDIIEEYVISRAPQKAIAV